MILAKFRVTEKTTYSTSPGFTQTKVVLTPMYSENPEDRGFSAATPSGRIELTVTKEGVAEQFPIGEDMFVTFSTDRPS